MTDNKTVKILFCSDGSDLKIDISLQATLEDLKHQISKLKSIEPKFQRVFHLGREIKNSRRSLHALGIGRYGAFVVHLHSSKPKVIELATEKKSVDVAVASNQVVVPATTGATTTRIIASSRNSARGRKRSRVTAPVSGSGRSGRMNRVNSNMPSGGGGGTNRTEEIIDLADSDDDDDDDDIEVIEIDKRSRRR